MQVWKTFMRISGPVAALAVVAAAAGPVLTQAEVSAPRIVSVSVVPRDQVNVPVRHRLAGGGAIINANVVGGRPQLTIETVTGLAHQGQHISAFSIRDLVEP